MKGMQASSISSRKMYIMAAMIKILMASFELQFRLVCRSDANSNPINTETRMPGTNKLISSTFIGRFVVVQDATHHRAEA